MLFHMIWGTYLKFSVSKNTENLQKSWDIQHPIHVKVTNWVSFCSLNSVWGTVVDGSPAKQLSLIAYLPQSFNVEPGNDGFQKESPFPDFQVPS